SDDLLFDRAIALQRANKTSESINALQMFLETFPKSRMTPGVKIRLALALADNHQAGGAIATLRDLLAKASPNQREPSSAEDQSEDKDNSGSTDDEESDDADNSQADKEKQSSDENSSESESGATGFGQLYKFPIATRLYMSNSEGYPAAAVHWNALDTTVYDNISGAAEPHTPHLHHT